MRIRGKSVLFRLAWVALLVAASSLRTSGHDLPMARGLDHCGTNGCFAEPGAKHAAAQLSADHQSVVDSLQSLAQLSRQAAQQVQQHLTDVAALWSEHNRSARCSPAPASHTLVIAAPTPGQAPRPRLPKSLQDGSRLADALHWAEDMQCQLCDKLRQPAQLQQQLSSLVARNFASPLRPLASLVLPQQDSKQLIADSAGPQYVVFDSPQGGHVLLTKTQLSQWNFDGSQVQASASGMLTSVMVPLQREAASFISRQLEVAGNALLHLSRDLAGAHQPRLANHPSGNRWE